MLLMPPANAALRAQDRDATNYLLTRLAACLAIHHAAHGEYPETLDSLIPKIMSTMPLDPYSSEPFIYKRCDKGYLLYSASANGVDDGGDDYEEPIVDGEWIKPESQSSFSPPDFFTADIVIRIPLPSPPLLELPYHPATSGDEP
jgi:hypothetical protein